MRSSIALAACWLVAVAAVVGGGLASDVARALTAPGTWAERRVANAYGGLDIPAVATLLDQDLPVDVPVMLSPAITNTLHRERLVEGLHPRRVVPRAPHVLELRPGQPWSGPAVTPPTTVPVREDTDFPWWAWCVFMASAAGWWMMLRHLLQAHRPAAPVHLQQAVAGMMVPLVGVLPVLVSTWAQWRFPVMLLWLTGMVLLALEVVRAWRRGDRPVVHAGVPLVLLLVAPLALCVALHPVSLWDGRSLWLMAARHLHHDGMIDVARVAEQQLNFHHPEYPLLYPTFLAWSASVLPAWHERLATFSIPFLAALLWAAASTGLRTMLGSQAAGAVLVFSAGTTFHLWQGGYVDGALQAALLAGAAFFMGGHPGAGWVALGVASMCKQEGTLLALLTGAVLGRRWWRGAVVLLPAVAHAGWARAQGWVGDFGSLFPGPGGPAAWERLQAFVLEARLLAVAPDYHGVRAGLAAAAVSGVLAAVVGLRAGYAQVRRLLVLSCLQGVALVCVYLVARTDLHWHVHTAAERVFLHPATLAVLALAAGTSTPGTTPSADARHA